MLNNIKTKQKGFTIVELLIVIVVIAILAAISIVAYNGIQNRGKTSAGASTAGSIQKKVEAFNTLNSAYPTYCQLVTNSNTPTGTQPAAGTAGAGSCVAGGTSAGSEAKIDVVSGLTPASAAAGTGYTSTVSDGNAVVGYFLCSATGATAGANVFYYDYANGAVKTVKVGVGC